MKKKQFMSKLAALTMVAAMGLTMVPTTVFAANTAEISAEDTQTANQDKMLTDVNAALAYVVTNAYASNSSKTALGVNSTRADVEAAIEYALKNGKGTGTTDLTDANYTASILGDITKGDIDTTATPKPTQAFKFNLQVKYADATEEIHNYAVNLDVPVNYADLTSAQKVDFIGAALKKAAEGVTTFSPTGEPDASKIKGALSTAYNGLDANVKQTAGGTANNISYTYTVNNIAGGSTESTNTSKGAVTGTITVKAPAVTADAGNNRAAQDAVSKDFTYSATRPFNDASLTSSKLDDVKSVLDGTKSGLSDDLVVFNGHSFSNDVTSEEIAAFANKYIQAMSTSDTSWQGITATVGGLTKVTKQTHDDAAANTTAGKTFTATVTLTDGTNTLANTFVGKLVHSDSEKLSEMDAALTKANSDYKITKLQSANQTTPATKADVTTAITNIIGAAIDSKPEENSALSTDGWSKSTSAKVYGYGTAQTAATSAKVSRNALKVTITSTSDDSYTNGSDKKADADYIAPNQIVADVAYTRATSEKEGKIVATITYAVADDSGDTTKVKADDGTTVVDATKTATKTTTLTLTVPKLKAKADTYLRFKDDSKTWVYNGKYVQNQTETKDGSVVDENEDEDNTYAFDLDSDLIRNGNDELVWTSSNPNSVIVSQDGVVTLKGVGEATITVASKSNPSLTDSIVVNSDNTYIFKDVQNSGSYYFEPVYWAARHNLTGGVSDDIYGVGKNLTRAQMITFLWRAAGKPTVATSSSFTDIPDGAYYEDAVNWAAAEGITTGTTDTTFSPNQALTRAQAVTFLYNAYGNGEKYTATKSSDFTDVSENAYYFDAVNWAVKNGITAGKSATKFCPDDICVREQGVTFLFRTVSDGMPYENTNLL